MGKKPLPVWPLSLLKHCLSLSPALNLLLPAAPGTTQTQTLESQPLPGGRELKTVPPQMQ